jgi:hypothetical protein
MNAPQNVIAVIFDFDDTLTDDSTTKLLGHHGLDPSDFWKNRAASMLRDGWDPTLAYLKLLLDEVGPGKSLGKLTNANLQAFGGTLKIYPGVATLFKDLKNIASKHPLSHPAVEFYVISGGLEEIIRGSSIARELSGIWGNRLWEDPQKGCVTHIQNTVTFTEKTKHLFEINKGIVEKSRREHYAVNELVDPNKRRVPFKNMIYVGDGLTDVPCFSLLQSNGGIGFGVFDPKKEGSPKKAYETLVTTRRTITTNSPHYGKTDDLGSLIRAAVTKICVDLDLELQRA